ncbi:hypothetical protein XNA1_3260008 [Xenorhabdus nematophila str. Anatoliense]|nr:hypothetical protein XNA1_3260008 [Xenorhabdus nematophila str. Anatoliense]
MVYTCKANIDHCDQHFHQDNDNHLDHNAHVLNALYQVH